jgi:NAD(P)-dependent dehydrogenase (short-subunit alcohol dehydrogenase family)
MTDLFDLSGKTALITGGNSGIGLGIAEALAGAGANIVLWGTNAAKNAAAEEALAHHGSKVLALACDVGDEAQVEAAFARSVEAMGHIDGCFANAGVSGGEHYSATKGGLIAMIRGLAVELARHHISANAILPGWIETDMTAQRLATEGFQTKVLKRVPARRWGEGKDFAGIAIYLMSDASRYHTGDTFVIDGGYSKF